MRAHTLKEERLSYTAITPATALTHTHIHRDKMMMWTGDEENVHLAVVSAPTKKPTRAQTPVRRWTCCWETGKGGGGGRRRGGRTWDIGKRSQKLVSFWLSGLSDQVGLRPYSVQILIIWTATLKCFFFVFLFFLQIRHYLSVHMNHVFRIRQILTKKYYTFQVQNMERRGPWWKLPLYVATFRTTSGPADSAEKLRQNWQPQHSFHRPVPHVDVLLGILSH